MKQTPFLSLQVIESKELPDVKAINISVRGYAKSQRSTTDGLVIFGTHNGCDQIPNNIVIVPCVDYVIENADFGFGEKHFAIFYETSTNEFKLVDLFQGTGTFVLLSEPTPMTNKKIVSFGSNHISFEQQADHSVLVKVVGGQL